MSLEQERQKLPTPKKLSDRGGLEDFNLDIRGKLAVDGNAIGGPTNQFYYVAGCLEGQAKDLMRPYVMRVVNSQDFVGQPEDFLKQIQHILGEPHRKRRAGLRLVTEIRQKPNERVSHYIARWEKTLYEAEADTWPDEAKILLLAGSLSDSTRKRLDRESVWQDTYNGFEQQLRAFDGVFSGRVDKENSPPDDEGDPMDTSIARVETVTCYKCGKRGHIRRNCPDHKGKQSKVSALGISTNLVDEGGSE